MKIKKSTNQEAETLALVAKTQRNKTCLVIGLCVFLLLAIFTTFLFLSTA